MHIFARAALLGYLVYWAYHINRLGYDFAIVARMLIVIVIPAILGYLSVNRSPPKDGLRHL